METQSLVENVLPRIDSLLLWGFIGTALMTIVLSGSRFMGWSRISLPFLVGTLFTGNRRIAEVVGFFLYVIGGWIFSLFYALIFESLRMANWWLGLVIGILHGLFLLTVALPLAPNLHPRLATEYDGPTLHRRIEPPGFMGLNYGHGTPLITLIGQSLYGLMLGLGYPL